jgi:hypothetical protein
MEENIKTEEERIEEGFKKLYEGTHISWDNFGHVFHPLYSAFINFKAGIEWQKQQNNK